MMSRKRLGIIALVPDDWNSIVTVRHQVLRRLAKWHLVEWLNPARNWRDFLKPFGSCFLASDSWSEPIPSMETLSTGWRHPAFYRPHLLSWLSFRSRLRLARERLVSRGADRIALYIWRDEFAEALDLVAHDFSCYHVDDEYSFSDIDCPNSARETALLRRVDQVIVHSPALYEKKGRINPNTALIPNGVDYLLFSTEHGEPEDVAGIPHPRIGYAGVIKRQLDLGLLIGLSRRRPDWSFVMVGPVTNVEGKEQQVAALRRMPNVYFLGEKPATRLPEYIQHFDVCMMCYELNGYTRYINPLKLHEYLASGRPTVSSPIEIVRGLEDVLSIAGGEDEWIAAIESAVKESHRESGLAGKRQAHARRSDWDSLVEQIAKLFLTAPVTAIRPDAKLVQVS